jgi:hypothetical protein
MRAYIEANGNLPPDCVLGYIAWFSVNDAAYDAERLIKDFDRLQLNSTMLPAPLRADDAFEKASKEIDKFKYAIVGGSTAEILIREVSRDARTIQRHMIREVKDSAGKRLLYEKVGELTFYRGRVVGGVVDQSSTRARATLDPALSPSERDILTPVVSQFTEAYHRYRDFHDGQKVRGILRNYLVYLNAVQMKPSVYFVHSSRADELERLKAFADGLGTASLMLLPQADLPRLRQDVIDAFQEEAEKDLQQVVVDIQKLRSSRSGDIRPTAFAKIKEDYDRVMRKASEYSRTLQIGQDRTAGAAELAVDALMALQIDVMKTLDKVVA